MRWAFRLRRPGQGIRMMLIIYFRMTCVILKVKVRLGRRRLPNSSRQSEMALTQI